MEVWSLIDQDDKVLPVAPVMGNKVIKIMPFGIEEKMNQATTRKKAGNTPIKKKNELKCTITAEKVDCQI